MRSKLIGAKAAEVLWLQLELTGDREQGQTVSAQLGYLRESLTPMGLCTSNEAILRAEWTAGGSRFRERESSGLFEHEAFWQLFPSHSRAWGRACVPFGVISVTNSRADIIVHVTQML